jgi:hypothetical protein
MSWTDERVETLKRMWAEGQSASQIAKELGGVTRNAVIGKVHRLGLSNRAPGGRDDEEETPVAAAKPEPKPEPAAQTNPHIAGQKKHASGGHGMAGAREDQGLGQQIEAHEKPHAGVAHRFPLRIVVTADDLQVEAAAQHAWPAANDHDPGLFRRAVEAGIECLRHRQRQRVRLAVIHCQCGNAVMLRE